MFILFCGTVGDCRTLPANGVRLWLTPFETCATKCLGLSAPCNWSHHLALMALTWDIYELIERCYNRLEARIELCNLSGKF